MTVDERFVVEVDEMQRRVDAERRQRPLDDAAAGQVLGQPREVTG